MQKYQCNYAYATVLYGDNIYWLGALTLGYSIWATKPKYPTLLLHTGELPKDKLNILRDFYLPVKVPTIRAHPTWIKNYRKSRWKQVFTKITALNQLNYDKILLLDTDMLVLRNMDRLFELSTPAALKLGSTHGTKLSPWTKINAGALLVTPDQQEYTSIKQQLNKPNRIKKGGYLCPEQEYLSARWSDRWTAIGATYNYQYFLHHKNPMPIAEIHNIHFSWQVKPWDLLTEKQRNRNIKLLESRPGHRNWKRYFREWLQMYCKMRKHCLKRSDK